MIFLAAAALVLADAPPIERLFACLDKQSSSQSVDRSLDACRREINDQADYMRPRGARRTEPGVRRAVEFWARDYLARRTPAA